MSQKARAKHYTHSVNSYDVTVSYIVIELRIIPHRDQLSDIYNDMLGELLLLQELLDLVWGYQYAGYSHTVNSHINRLRGKIESEPEHPRFIRTVWGVGYRFAEEEELEADEQPA